MIEAELDPTLELKQGPMPQTSHVLMQTSPILLSCRIAGS
jgi:hypothetical protein